MSRRLLLFLVSFLLLTGTACSKLKDPYTISEPYEYPIQTDSEEWKTMSLKERREAVFVDTDIANAMTSQALLLTVIRYPFIVDIFAYDDCDNGVDAVRTYCPPLDVFINRTDAIQTCKDYLDPAEESLEEESFEKIVVRQLLQYLTYNRTE